MIVQPKAFLPKNDTTIWRYFIDWKFEQFLGTFQEHHKWPQKTDSKTVHFNECGQIWFSYPWTFGDQLEGSLPDANKDPKQYCKKMAELQRLSAEDAEMREQHFLNFDSEALKECILSMSRICGVSCWHENDSESSDMWSLFVRGLNGVAIKTTVGQLLHGLKNAHSSPGRFSQPSVCSVEYVDHSTYFLPSDGFRNLLGIIQTDYSYENEVRLLAKSPGLAALPTKISRPVLLDPKKWSQASTVLSKDEKEDHIKKCGEECKAYSEEMKTKNEKGFNLPINLKGLINEVVFKSGSTNVYQKQVADKLRLVGVGDAEMRESTI